MSSDLVVAIFAGGAIFKIDTAENSIFAVAITNFKDSFLDLFLFLLIFACELLSMLEFGIVGEEIGLSEFEFGTS